jgi:hypothetical protein
VCSALFSSLHRGCETSISTVVEKVEVETTEGSLLRAMQKTNNQKKELRYCSRNSCPACSNQNYGGPCNTEHTTLHPHPHPSLGNSPVHSKVPGIPLHTVDSLAHVNFQRDLTSVWDEFLDSHPHHNTVSHPTQPSFQFRTLLSAPTKKQKHTRTSRLRV